MWGVLAENWAGRKREGLLQIKDARVIGLDEEAYEWSIFRRNLRRKVQTRSRIKNPKAGIIKAILSLSEE